MKYYLGIDTRSERLQQCLCQVFGLSRELCHYGGRGASREQVISTNYRSVIDRVLSSSVRGGSAHAQWADAPTHTL